ncbi:hypothetical protein [Zoogloea sp.]|uniref:hypothetical protein n=1 Tax=Zoogloea sp. TaxID=49181 RepID=UPI0035AE8F67
MVDFPGWAPASLVEKYLREQADEARRREQAQADKVEKGVPAWWLDEIAREEEHQHFLEQLFYQQGGVEILGALFRLLTHPDMELAWESLRRHPQSKKIHANFVSWGFEEALWWHVRDCFNQFRIISKRTAQEKKKSMLRVARAARDLVEAIREDPDARGMAEDHISHVMGVEQAKYQMKYLEDRPSPGLLFMPSLNLKSEAHSARNLLEVVDWEWYEGEDSESGKFRQWRQWSDSMRFAYWTDAAASLSLVELLSEYAKDVEYQAGIPPEIKQPGRADSVFKPYFIRKTSGWMKWFYGQPLDDTTARVVTAVLGLSTPLTRDDVRPYRDKS